jgi:uncharacterized membrane protein YbhN (UPF0104 family)
VRDDSSTGSIVPTGWRAAVGVVTAVGLVVGVGLLIARAAGFAEVRAAIERADSTWFFVCLAAQVVALWAYAEVLRGGFSWRGGPDPGPGLASRVMLASIGATRVFAAGGVGAIAATYWCFRRARFAPSEALVRILGFNGLFYVAFAAVAWTAALFAATGVWGDAPLALTVPWLVVVPLFVAAAVLVTQPARVERLARLDGSLVRRSVSYAIAAARWAREVLLDPAGRKMVAATAVYWAGNLLSLWASLRSVGVELPLPELILAYSVGHAATILPLPLGGAGGVDAALTYSLTAVGVPLATALVAVGVFRLFAFWAPTIPGLTALLLLPRTGVRLARLEWTPSVP